MISELSRASAAQHCVVHSFLYMGRDVGERDPFARLVDWPSSFSKASLSRPSAGQQVGQALHEILSENKAVVKRSKPVARSLPSSLTMKRLLKRLKDFSPDISPGSTNPFHNTFKAAT